MAQPDPKKPVRFGKYTLIDRIAVGGMAEIPSSAWKPQAMPTLSTVLAEAPAGQLHDLPARPVEAPTPAPKSGGLSGLAPCGCGDRAAMAC